ncbi:MAG: alpha/beta hydrolase [Epulopiscium sp.]|nr:alpha/beta hydrolase [Candidatus Epulonipiscium sp.]
MTKQKINFTNEDGIKIAVYKWKPEEDIKGAVQIAHGMAEHAMRYEYFAKALTKEGYVVYANDHRGHGQSAASIEELGYISDNDGFSDMVKDMKALTNIIREENPGIPLILFSHSMGSFLAQRYIQIYGKDIDGVILSGTNGKQAPITNLGLLISKVIMKSKGRKASGKLMDKMAFGSYNNKIDNNKTKFDWLTRDADQVQKYIDDPYCGTLFPVSFFHDLINGTRAIHKKENLKNVPKDLPIYIFAGDADPVGNYGKGIISLRDLYKSLGIKNVTSKLYEGGRHEMLNEINRDEVIEDVISWLDTI